MNSRDKIKKEVIECLKKGLPLILYLQNDFKKEEAKNFSFQLEYQKWYSRAIKIVEFLGKDRLQEFKSYYEIDPKRKTMGYGDYYIQDYLKGVAPNSVRCPKFDTAEQTVKNVFNQYAILNSINDRIDSVLYDIQTTLFVELQDVEIETAKSLLKINLRSSGVIAGVVLESYLSKIADNHSLKLSKRNPTLSDFNEILKNSNIYDTTVWRKVSYLGDIRNLCAHKKDTEPTKDQVEELINGVHWVTKNVF